MCTGAPMQNWESHKNSADLSSFSQVKVETLTVKRDFPKLGLVADPVIKAIARLEFEDGMRTGVLPGGCWGP